MSRVEAFSESSDIWDVEGVERGFCGGVRGGRAVYQCAFGGKTSLPVVLTAVTFGFCSAGSNAGSGVTAFALSFTSLLGFDFGFFSFSLSFSCGFLEDLVLASIFFASGLPLGSLPDFKPCRNLETSPASEGYIFNATVA